MYRTEPLLVPAVTFHRKIEARIEARLCSLPSLGGRFASSIASCRRAAATEISRRITGSSDAGREEAYFCLRQQGYVIVARNYRSPRRRGGIDLMGWDQDVLCFMEVKTRTSRDVKPAEAAVDREKRRELGGMARDCLRGYGKQCSRVSTWSAFITKTRVRCGTSNCLKMRSQYRKIPDSSVY